MVYNLVPYTDYYKQKHKIVYRVNSIWRDVYAWNGCVRLVFGSCVLCVLLLLLLPSSSRCPRSLNNTPSVPTFTRVPIGIIPDGIGRMSFPDEVRSFRLQLVDGPRAQ